MTGSPCDTSSSGNATYAGAPADGLTFPPLGAGLVGDPGPLKHPRTTKRRG